MNPDAKMKMKQLQGLLTCNIYPIEEADQVPEDSRQRIYGATDIPENECRKQIYRQKTIR